MPIDGAIYLLSIPVMSKPAFLHLRPPKIDIASIDDEHSELGVYPIDIDYDVSKFFSRNPP